MNERLITQFCVPRWRPGSGRWIARLTFALAAVLTTGFSSDLAQRVIILANASDPGSMLIAQHYAERRAVPAANIIALKLSQNETTAWSEFIPSLWLPLQAELIDRGWIDAIPMALADALGRKKYAVFNHRIAALVVCRGVPLRISNDSSLESDRPPLMGKAEFRTNAGAVDSELALMAMSSTYPISGFVENPLFQNERPTEFELSQIIKVSRLDGPTVEDANALVDQAIAAEHTGLLGRAYVDLGGNYPQGNRWLESVATQISDLGFDLSVDRDPSTFQEGARMDAPALYFGWYANDLNGPFALPGFRFPPGAVAFHIHSFSARTLHSTREGWCGPLVARGVTATMGNVYEPYLQLTLEPQLLLRALAAGANLVDAAYYALPVLSWQAVLVGDPLYRPFLISNAEQLEKISSLPPALVSYAELRRQHLLESAGHPADALALSRKFLSERPNLALGLAVARELHAEGNDREAAEALAFAPGAALRVDEWGLAREVAAFLVAIGQPSRAITIYRTLLREKDAPFSLHVSWQREAESAATAQKTALEKQ